MRNPGVPNTVVCTGVVMAGKSPSASISALFDISHPIEVSISLIFNPGVLVRLTGNIPVLSSTVKATYLVAEPNGECHIHGDTSVPMTNFDWIIDFVKWLATDIVLGSDGSEVAK